MGRDDTGLSNNTPTNEDVTPNRDLQPVQDEDSDSDSDASYGDRMGNYTLLSQNPVDGDNLFESDSTDSTDSDDEEVQNLTGIAAVPEEAAIPVPYIKGSESVIVEEVWSQPTPKELDIEMSQKKIDMVKQMMVNIQLPNESIPDWAKNIPEDKWKDHLKRLVTQSEEETS